jgi:hypothetical protein
VAALRDRAAPAASIRARKAVAAAPEAAADSELAEAEIFRKWLHAHLL